MRRSRSRPRTAGDWKSGWRVATVATDEQVDRKEALGVRVDVSLAPGQHRLRAQRPARRRGLCAGRVSRQREPGGRARALRDDRSERPAAAPGRGMRVMSPSRTVPRIRGFTLIEVLIALVVLAFGMLALARALGRSAQEELEAQQRAQAMTIAGRNGEPHRQQPEAGGACMSATTCRQAPSRTAPRWTRQPSSSSTNANGETGCAARTRSMATAPSARRSPHAAA